LYSEPIPTLLKKVGELLEIKYDYLRGLSNLTVLDIRRVANTKEAQQASSVGQLMKKNHDSVQMLPMKGVVKDRLRANDHVIVCALESSDMWLKFKLHMAWGLGKTLESEVELKIDRLMTGMNF